MCNLLRSKRLKWTHALIFFVIVAAASSPSIAADDPDSIQAEQKLRGYFEFPRKPLEERGHEGLLGAHRVLKATPSLPALIFTSLLWLASTLDPDATYWKGSLEEVTKRALEHAAFLLEHGADVNAKGRTEGRVLEEALEHKAPPEFVQLLIKHGALKDGEH